MKILHMTNTLDLDGTGINNVLVDLCLEQASHGHDVSVVSWSSDNQLIQDLAVRGINMRTIPAWRNIAGLGATARQLRRLEVFREADVIHVHTVRAYGSLLASFMPRIWYRSVSTLHNPFQRSTLLLLTARKPVSVSQKHAQLLTQQFGPVGKRVGTVLNRVVGTKRLAPFTQVRPRKLAGEQRFLYVGGLLERKGIETLVQIMEQIVPKHPGAHLYIVGNRDNPSFERRVAGSPAAAHIHLEGFAADPREYMVACDVFVFPSHVEAFGLVLTEARNCGMAVLASDIDGIPEAMDMGEAGILLPPKDVARWVTVLDELCTNPEELKKLRERALRGIDAFAVGTMATEYQKLYESLPAQRRTYARWFSRVG